MFRTSIPVFCYHTVCEEDGHTPQRFREHLDAMLDAGYRTISALELLAVVRGEMKAPPKSVVLTFDDGHISNFVNAVPELEKRGMTGTFFALSDFTVPGKIRSADDMPSMLPMPESFKNALQGEDHSQFINEGEIRDMISRGMEVFSHGCRHQGTFRTLRPYARMGEDHARWPAWGIYPDFNADHPTFDAASAYVYDGFWPKFGKDGEPRFAARPTQKRLSFCRNDFMESFERFRALNGCSEQLFCWPWGQFCDDAEAELKKAGYAGAFTLERWVNAEGTDPFRLNRLGVGKQKTGKWVQQRLKMYGSDPAARVFFKLHTKKPEVKRVLYVTDSEKLSGGSRQLVNNIAAMNDLGVRPYAVLSPKSPIVGALDGMDVEIIPFDRFRDYFHAGAFLKKTVREHGIDVVHSFHNRAYKMGILARLMGAKCKVFINRGVISRPNDVFFLWTALANGVFTNSMQCADVLRKHHVMKRRLNVVYNAYNGPDFGEPPFRKKRGVRFVYVGNPAEIKGFDVFLQAATRLCENGNYRDMEFVGVGIDQHFRERFAPHMSPEVGERLRLTGDLPHDQVLEELQFSDILVVPSRKESLPNTLLEGFDLGLPAVCTDVGGISELLRDGVNGYLCANEDADCLAEKMRVLAENPEMRFNMGRAGRNIIRTLLTLDAKGHNLMRVYMGETLCQPLPVEKGK